MTDRKRNTNSIFIFIFSFIAGVFAASFIFISPLVSALGVFVGFAILLAEKIYNEKVGKEALFLSIAIIALGLGTLRYSVKDFHTPLQPDFTGVVISEPELRENSTRFVMKSSNGEKLLVTTDLYSPVQYGDRVEVEGDLREPGLIDDGIGRPFDYAAYLSKDDIYFTMSFAEVEIVSHKEGSPPKHFLFNIKDSLIVKIRQIFSEPESSLLAGLIVAGKAAMPESILEEFRRAGIIHIVVLSGYNVTIIAEFMRKSFENLFLFARLGARPKLALGASILGVVFFVLATGAEATVVRAALMVLVVIAAKMFGRSYSAPRALLGAGFIMVIHNPKILVFDPSFQLSFIATAALIYLAPIAYKYIRKIPRIPSSLGEILATTIATQVAVLPLLIYSMGDVSLVSLPANVLVLLFIPTVMFTGFIAALLVFITPMIALPFSYVSHLLLAWILGVSHYLSNLSFALISVPQIPFWIVVAVYIVMIILVRWRLISLGNTSNLDSQKSR